MEYIMVWVLIFAGATIGLLVTFLMASERELRAQEEIATKRASSDAEQNQMPTERVGIESTTSDQLSLNESQLLGKYGFSEIEKSVPSVEEYHDVAAALKEIVRLRKELVHTRQELQTRRRTAERWHQAREKLSEIMGQQAALNSDDHKIQDQLMALATLMIDDMQAAPVISHLGASTIPLNGHSPDNTFKTAAAVPPLFASPEEVAATAGESSATSHRKRNGALVIGIFVTIIGALGTQAWRFTGVSKSDGVDAGAQARTVRQETVREPSSAPAAVASQAQITEVPLPERKTAAAAESQPPKSGTLKASNAAQRENLLAQERRENVSGELRLDVANNGPISYAAIQTGQVYSRPDETSSAVGEIEPGMEVLVVNAQSGWLEIRSKHGRPSGYIRSEIAVRQSEQK